MTFDGKYGPSKIPVSPTFSIYNKLIYCGKFFLKMAAIRSWFYNNNTEMKILYYILVFKKNSLPTLWTIFNKISATKFPQILNPSLFIKKKVGP